MSRPLSVEEKRLLLHMVAAEPQEKVLRAQIEGAEYDSPWFDGSQSFDIHISDRSPLEPTGVDMPEGRRTSHVFTVHAADSGAAIGEIFLWIEDGKVSALEYAWNTDQMPERLPEIGQLS